MACNCCVKVLQKEKNMRDESQKYEDEMCSVDENLLRDEWLTMLETGLESHHLEHECFSTTFPLLRHAV